MAENDDTKPAVLVDLPEDIFIPEPFAFAGTNGTKNNVELLARNDENAVGSFAHVQCSCGQPFRCDLLNGDLKACPNCGTHYAHFLVIAADDDPDVVWQAWRHLLDVNGFDVTRRENEPTDEEPDETPPTTTAPPEE